MNDVYLAYLLLAIGLILMAAELFLPTGGILFAIGISGLIAGLAMVFLYDKTQGLITLIALFVLLGVGGPMVLQIWSRSALGKQLLLPGQDDDATVANMPVHLELEQLRGRYGRTVSPLRPAGITDFDGRRIDTLSEGPLIEAGKWVRCIDVSAGKVVVSEVPRPPAMDDMDLTELT
jgi:membrane-bound ClpP family serine protease